MSPNLDDRPLRTAVVTGLVVALVAIILALDLLAPRGVALGAAYVCPVLLAFASPRRTLPVEVASVASVLAVLDYFVSSDYVGAPWVVVVNRTLSVGMIWFVALLSLEHRRVGAALRHAEARNTAVVEAAMDAIVIVDPAGRIRGTNPAAARMFGLDGPTQGRPVVDLLPAWGGAELPASGGVMDGWGRRGDGAAFPARLAVSRSTLEDEPLLVVIVHDTSELRSRGQSLGLLLAHLPIEVSRVGPDDELLERHGDAISRLGLSPRTLLAGLAAELRRARAGEAVNIRAPAEADGRTFTLEHWLVHDAVRSPWVVWSCVDVSDQRRMERKVEVTAKLAALGELAGNIAHEINNPIGIISAKARLLMTSPEPLTDKARQELGKIAAQCDRVGGLTRKLVNYVRPKDGGRARVDLRAPARRALSFVSTKAERQGVEAVDALDGTALPVVANEDELEQVFLNLLLNALDAMPGGGTLRVRGERTPGRAAVTVADTGAGMDADVQRRLFEPFFTTKSGHGTGLGLHICHGIVQAHGGEIEVESAPGMGARFRVELALDEAGVGAGAELPVLDPGQAVGGSGPPLRDASCRP